MPPDFSAKSREIARKVADRCHGSRKPGAAPHRYAIIYRAAFLGAMEALRPDG
jgi:hypothetical protein